MTSDFNRDLLALARESRGVTQQELADQVRTTQGRISKIENGILEPDGDLVGALATALGYPPSFFYQPDGVLGLPAWFYRKRKSLAKKIQNQIFADVNIVRLQVARLLRSIEIDHAYTLPQLDVDDYDGDVASIAREVRGHWQLPPGPIRNVTTVLEDAGIVVVPMQFGVPELDAIAFRTAGTPPLVFADTTVTADRLRFSLAHELGHLVMHTRSPSATMEQEANDFASEFLMPATDIASEFRPGLKLSQLAALKPVWRVSMAALLMRAYHLGRVSERRYRYLWVELGRRGWRRREPPELDLPSEPPSALAGLVDFHLQELGYSPDELAEALHATPSSFAQRYLNRRKLQLVTG